jgi:hypothetical protein
LLAVLPGKTPFWPTQRFSILRAHPVPSDASGNVLGTELTGRYSMSRVFIVHEVRGDATHRVVFLS